MSPRQIPADVGRAAIAAYKNDRLSGVDNTERLALACRFALQEFRKRAPGRSVEVRVPPYGAVQVIEGPTHTRGTPPAVVEMAPEVWLGVAIGDLVWEEAVESGAVQVSGNRANLQEWLPLSELG